MSFWAIVALFISVKIMELISHMPLTLIKIEDGGFHLIVKVIINGKAANMILDTGASKTAFDFNSILNYINKEKLSDIDVQATGLGSNSINSKVVNIKSFKFGEIDIKNYKAVVIDMAVVIETYKKLGLRPFVGVLGSDLLYKLKANIDFEGKLLKLIKRTKSVR